MDETSGLPVTVYLLHFEAPIGSDKAKGKAQHYIGATTNLKQRLAQHYYGRSASIVRAFHEKGIAFTVANLWENSSFQFEHYLKNVYKNAPRLCSICNKQREINAENKEDSFASL